MGGTLRDVLAGTALLVAASMPARAEVAVAGWPGGPEEIALRKVADIYNAMPGRTDDDKVKLLFFIGRASSTSCRPTWRRARPPLT